MFKKFNPVSLALLFVLTLVMAHATIASYHAKIQAEKALHAIQENAKAIDSLLRTIEDLEKGSKKDLEKAKAISDAINNQLDGLHKHEKNEIKTHD